MGIVATPPLLSTIPPSPPWADVVVDLRGEEHRLPVFARLHNPERTLTVGDWVFTAHVSPEGPVGGSTSILLATAPDGWRAGFVMTQFSGRRFAYSELGRRWPYLGRLLSTRRILAATRTATEAALLAGLPVLRSLLLDPQSWYATEVPRRDWEDHWTETGWAVAWASAGVTSVEVADRLDINGIWPVGRTDGAHADLLSWQQAGWDVQTVLAWLDAGVHTPAWAAIFGRAEVDPEEAQCWAKTPLVLFDEFAEYGQCVVRFARAGWTPAWVGEVADVEAAALDPVSVYKALAAWQALTSPQRAVLYLRAGIGRAEAARFEASAEPPSTAQLATLAALVA